MKHTRQIIKDKAGISTILEGLIAIGISVTLLTVFFISANNAYRVHERSDVDLKAKSMDIIETLINSRGQGKNYGFNWEDDPANVRLLGLSASPVVVYGTISISDGIVTINSYDYTDNGIGLANPEVLIGKDIYPGIEKTTETYSEKYYVEYEPYGVIIGNYLFEIKGKTNSERSVLDYQKVSSIRKVPYDVAKSALGLGTDYDFNIVISNNLRVISEYGASYEDSSGDVVSTERQVLIYHGLDKKEPYYENGIITLTVFQGGQPLVFENPNQAPDQPDNPSPADDAKDISIDGVLLGWTCGHWGESGQDPDGDPVTYDVYFGETNPPPKVTEDPIDVQSYALPTLTYSKPYYWKIVAWDNHGASTSGDIWSFETGDAPDQAPYPPTNPSPGNGDIGVSINTDFSWSCLGDPDPGDEVTYDVYLDVNLDGDLLDPGDHVGISLDTTFYNYPFSLTPGELYIWRVDVTDNHGKSTSGPEWSFTTNTQPNVPSNPSPTGSDVDVNADLSWDGGDQDPTDTVTYDVYFGTTNPPPYKGTTSSYPSSTIGITYEPGAMNPGTTYYWNITARDNHGGISKGSVWSFATAGSSNEAPYDPNSGEATNDSTTLEWKGGDPDIGDNVDYQVYLEQGDSTPDVLRTTLYNYPRDPQYKISYIHGLALTEGTTYYWQINAIDSQGLETLGPVWQFTTSGGGFPNSGMGMEGQESSQQGQSQAGESGMATRTGGTGGVLDGGGMLG